MSDENIASSSFFAKITHLIYHQPEYGNFKEVLALIAQEAQTTLQVDRVKIYRFATDASGEVVAESLVHDRLPSLLGLHFPDTDLPNKVRQSLVKSTHAVTIDVTARRKTIYTETLHTANSSKVELIYQPADPCHLQYLLTMGVLSSLTVPIFYWNDLWGLLVVHHSEPRRFQQQELTLMQLLSKQISLALNQEALIVQSKQEQKQQNIIEQINQIWWENLGSNHQTWTSILETSVKQLNADGGLAYITPELTGKPSQIHHYGQRPYCSEIDVNNYWLDLIKKILVLPIDQEKQNLSYYPQAYTRKELEANFDCKQLLNYVKPEIHSFLFIILHYHHQWLGCLTLFREEREWEIHWAGREENDSRNQKPRQSFATWCELKRGSPYWTNDELKLAEKIGRHLYILLTQERLDSLIHHGSNYDSLTQLPNNQIFSHQVNLSLVNAVEKGEILGIVMLDLDQFKRINESLGHKVGDYLVQKVGERIRDYLETKKELNPLLARWHGDRFMILLHKLTYTDELIELCKEILQKLQNPFYFQSHIIDLSASLGISLAPYDGDRAETLINNAETAMYQAKARGKNTFQLYNPQLKQQDFNWLALAADLKRAISREELTLQYQPQISFKTKTICGVEALARWYHPKHGWISPAKFIPLAEEIGLIHDLGEWVLKTACEQHRLWEMLGLPSLKMSVNLSGVQFTKPTLLGRIESILTATQMDGKYLTLEITESTLVENLAETVKVLEKLNQQGVKIAIDDFGTGYSSLSVLKNLPVNILKIDRAFITNIAEDESAARLCQSIIFLGKSLNLQIIAEGVETMEQADLLQKLDCDAIQGYLISPPLESEPLSQILMKKWSIERETSENQPAASLALKKPINLSEHQEVMASVRQNSGLIEAYIALKQQLKKQNIRERLVMEVAQKIRQSLNLEEIMETTVTEVRHLLQADRVFLYQFNADWSGTVVVESVSESELSILGDLIDDPCFREQYIKHYRQGRIKAIADVTKEELASCHLELLTRYQVKSNLVLPIVHQEKLWGLLIVHQCRETRQWEPQEVTLLSQLTTQTAIAIHQGELYEQLSQANLKLQKLSSMDGLTQVANRYRFDNYLQEQWNRLLRSEDVLSLILCDVDYFKQYNDTYGHQQGDECLIAIAKAIASVLKRPDDLVARYGGEEFAVVLPNTSLTGTLTIARRIQAAIKALEIPHVNSEHQIVTLSLGVSCIIPQVSLSPQALIQEADQALYLAKAKGRDTISGIG
ncbi:diguanylate cyclase domain-containing protein [Gloeocapsa sp. PCC 73106]|uniref:diguanylate cyclase domain-containing protein n=1 Tax=Gloeocapsa sp. PCC 73106 TaxID=102232 RepID=UPI0002AC142B|nr:diguanylate cyclase [Gloeocapsa sp. PCC 73106]ELR97514.1 diguanylate cyclase (GGDEF) domain-containing protein [Gloeocapsa sp. PCC 73106]